MAHIFKWEEKNTGDSRFLDWDNFKLEFRKEFCPANSEATAINKLESTTYYQRTQSVDDYLDKFLDLVAESGHTDPKVLVVKFRRGLDPQIQNAMATMANGRPSDTTPITWYKAARNVDQNRKHSGLLTTLLPPAHSALWLYLCLLQDLPQSRHKPDQLQITQYPWKWMEIAEEHWCPLLATAVVNLGTRFQTALFVSTCEPSPLQSSRQN